MVMDDAYPAAHETNYKDSPPPTRWTTGTGQSAEREPSRRGDVERGEPQRMRGNRHERRDTGLRGAPRRGQKTDHRAMRRSESTISFESESADEDYGRKARRRVSDRRDLRRSESPRPNECTMKRIGGCGLVLFVMFLAMAGASNIFVAAPVVDSYKVVAQVLGPLTDRSQGRPRERAIAGGKELSLPNDPRVELSITDGQEIPRPLLRGGGVPPRVPSDGVTGGESVAHNPRPAALIEQRTEQRPSTVAPTPVPTPPPTPAPTPLPTAEVTQQEKVIIELVAFYESLGNKEKAAKARTIVNRAASRPAALYSALAKHYPAYVDKFIEARRWAESNPQAGPGNYRRPEVGEVVRLAKNAREDGSIRQGQMGTIIADEKDSQPFQVKNKGGVTFWYAETEVIVVSTADALAYNSGRSEFTADHKGPK